MSLTKNLQTEKECIHCTRCPAWKSSLFSDMSPFELDELANKKEELILKKNEAAFNQNEPTRGLYCVGTGGMKIFQNSGAVDTLIRIAPPGDSIGYRSIFVDKHYKGSAIAMTNSQLCFISMELINHLLNSNPLFALKLIRKMAGEINRSEDLNIAQRQKNVRERMAAFILNYEKSFKVESEGLSQIELKLTRAEIASLIGSAEDTVIRLFKEFKDNGWIEENAKNLVIKDHSMLNKLAGA